MAESKKSFIAYSDWQGTFKALPDDIAGQLIKYIFSYVNDEEPEPHENFVVNALFEQFKATLKRDLHKWDKQREQRSKAGKKSAEIRATKINDRSTTVNETERKATVSVSDSVNVSDTTSIKENSHQNYFEQCLEDEVWCETTMMQNKLRNLETLNKYLEIFLKHCIQYKINKENLQEFCSHFLNWLRKQDIQIAQPPKQKMRYS